MKICFIAPAYNYHTQKWCGWFLRKGYEVHVISFADAKIEGATVHWINSGATAQASDGKKLKYLLQAHRMRKLVREINPDMISVHYASSYGAVAALAGIRNYALSVWGSDVYDFPNRSALHKLLLKFSLRKATYLLSTSHAMAQEGGKYTDKPFDITPFGVDMKLFSSERKSRPEGDGAFVLGTVKALKPVYGIDSMLKAVAEVRSLRPDIPLQLRIAGSGEYEGEYRDLANKLGISDITHWLGFISQAEAAREWADMDVGIIFSERESFGVSAVEAQACETPVLISDVPGLMEATKPGETSIVVAKGDTSGLARAIIDLYDSPEKRADMGKKGRAFVSGQFEIEHCFNRIEKLIKRSLS